MDEELLAMIQLRPGVENISVGLLEDIITDIQVDFRSLTNYPDDLDIPTAAYSVMKDMVMTKINRLGYEGIASTSVSGTSESYIDGYPADLMKRIMRFRRLKL